MNPSEKWQAALAQLAHDGLNIFAACAWQSLPADLRVLLPNSFTTLCLVGHGGRTLWERMPQPVVAGDDPIDRFSVARVTRFAAEVLDDPAPQILFPGGAVHLPLQRLGRFFNICRPSHLGLDINSEFGPWFAFRCVFLTSAAVPETIAAPFSSPCESCTTKPCQSACPAQAVSGAGFQMSRCADYRLEQNSPCLDRCLARLRCPVHAEHQYSEEQIRYHMLRPGHLQKLAGYRS